MLFFGKRVKVEEKLQSIQESAITPINDTEIVERLLQHVENNYPVKKGWGYFNPFALEIAILVIKLIRHKLSASACKKIFPKKEEKSSTDTPTKAEKKHLLRLWKFHNKKKP